MKSMIDNAIEFDEKWFDLDVNEVKILIKKNSKNDFVYIEYSYTQLGRDEAWFEDQCRQLEWNLFKIKREVKLEWMYASNDSPFSEEQLETISEFVKDPAYTITIDNIYRFNVMYPLSNIFSKSWIVAIDIATGLSKDSSAITVIDPYNGKPAIVFKSNTIDIPDLVDLTVKLVKTYLPSAVIVPERNSIGIPFINLLLKTEVAHQVYYEVRSKDAEVKVEEPGAFSVRKKKSEVRIYGVHTTKDNRKIMTEQILNNIVNEAPENINNKYMFNEIKTLIRTTGGIIDHKPGEHDDVLMSYLIGLYALYYGKNVNRFVKVTNNYNELVPNNNSNTKAANKIKTLSEAVNNPLDMKQFKETEQLLKRYEKMQKEQPKPVEHSTNNKKILENSKDLCTDKVQTKKKISKNLLNTLSSFNKR